MSLFIHYYVQIVLGFTFDHNACIYVLWVGWGELKGSG